MNADVQVGVGEGNANMFRQWLIIGLSVLHVIVILLIDDTVAATQASKTLTRFHDPVI